MSRSECLLNNALNDDFQKMLWPYHIPQKLLCAAKYRIKDNFILPNSRVYCVLSVLVLLFITYTYFTPSSITSCTLENHCMLITDGHYLLANFIATACVIIQTEAAVELLIRMQTVDRKLRSFGVTNLKYSVAKNWFFIVFLVLYYGSTMLYMAFKKYQLPWAIFVGRFFVLIFDLEILHAICIVEFLRTRLECTSMLFSAHNLNHLNVSMEKNLKESFKNLFMIPKEILQAFTEANLLAQYSVLTNITSTFISSLVTVQIIINLAKNVKQTDFDMAPQIVYLYAALWHIQKWVFVVMFSVACERFYSRIQTIKSICATILEQYPEPNEYHNTAKNILRLCDARYSKMRVCGLFVVDAVLPLRIAGLIATYSIVLLQFAFL